jgi:hypothetical protein
LSGLSPQTPERPGKPPRSNPGYVYRVCCPDCAIKAEKVPQLPSKAPFGKRFEDAVGLACESAAARQVARQFGLPAGTVRAIDLRYAERWAAARKKPARAQMGVDEILLGKKRKFVTVVHAHQAIDEVRRAGFNRKGPRMRELVKGRRWLLPTRRVNLNASSGGN